MRTRWWGAVSPKRSLLFTTLMLMTGCDSGSAVDKVAKELSTVRSWAATAHMVGATWMAGSAPTTYGIQTLLAAQQKVQEGTARLQSEAIPADARAGLLGHLQNLETTLGQMRAVIQRADRDALAQQISLLSAEEKSIASFAKGGSLQP